MHADPAHVVSNKMAESESESERYRWRFRREIPLIRGENGNKSSKFTSRELELQKKPHESGAAIIREPCLEIYSNFNFLPERYDPAGGEDKLPAENLGNYATVMAKFDEYLQKSLD